MKSEEEKSLRKQNRLVIVLSIVLIAVVAFLYLGPNIEGLGIAKGALPKINAYINGFTTILLIAGLVAIKNGKRQIHERIMLTALISSILFLVLYIIQHIAFPSTEYPEGIAGRDIYLGILLSHIVLATAIVPLVLLTVVRAFAQRFDKHRKIARITYPLWLYVSITGVIVYIMISPFY